jgi:hypothetical protein
MKGGHGELFLGRDLEVGCGLKEGLEGGALGGESEQVEDGGDLVRDRPKVFGVDECVKDLALEGIEACGFGGRFEACEVKKGVGHVDRAVWVDDGQKVEQAGDHKFGDTFTEAAKQAAEIPCSIGFGPRKCGVKVGYFGECEGVHEDTQCVSRGLLGCLAGEGCCGSHAHKCGIRGIKVAFEQRFKQDIVDFEDTKCKEDTGQNTRMFFDGEALLKGFLDAFAFGRKTSEQKSGVDTQSGLWGM